MPPSTATDTSMALMRDKSLRFSDRTGYLLRLIADLQLNAALKINN